MCILLETARAVTLWDARTLTPAGVLPGLSATVQALAFSPDGESIAAAEVDAERPRLHVWNVGRRTVTARANTPGVTSLTFSPDGAGLYAVSTGRRGIRLETDPEAWKRHACLVSGRELTAREWNDALPDRPYSTVC